MNRDYSSSFSSTRPPTQSEIEYSIAIERHSRRERRRARRVTLLLALVALALLLAVVVWGPE